MTTQRIAVVAVILAAIAAAHYYGAFDGFIGKTTEEHVMQVEESEVENPWTFEDKGEVAGVPQTKVSLNIHGEVVAVGTYEGTCADITETAWTVRDGASEGAICWFAGGGTEIGVFHENEMHLVKTAVLDEGSAEVAGVRGEWKVLLSK